MKRIASVAVATVLALVMGSSTALAAPIESSGSKACAGKFGVAFGTLFGSWTNKPPGSTKTYNGTVDNDDDQYISRIAPNAGGGSWKITATRALAETGASCSSAG